MNSFVRGIAGVAALALLLIGALQVVQVRDAHATVVGDVEIGVVIDGVFEERDYTTSSDSARDNVVQVTDLDYAAAGSDDTGASDVITLESIGSDSSSDGWDCPLVLSEVAGDAGVFQATFLISDAVDADGDPSGEDEDGNCGADTTPTIYAEGGDDITAEYSDGNPVRTRRDTIEIETDGPAITELKPADGFVADDDEVDVSAEVRDEASGVDELTIVFLVADTQFTDDDIFDADGDPLPLASLPAAIDQVYPDSETGLDDIDDDDPDFGKEAEVEVIVDLDADDFGTTFVTVAAIDKAGNLTILDIDDDDEDVVFAQYTVDDSDPSLGDGDANTGIAFNDTDVELDTNERDWIQLIFSDETDLDGDSIQAADFLVEGHTVIDAEWYDEDPTDLDGDGVDDVIRRMVFLQLADELDADEEPDVFVVPGSGGILDEAGNDLTSDDIGSDDNIGPEFEVTSQSHDLAGDGDEVVLTISADEGLQGDEPSVTVESVESAGDFLDFEIDQIGSSNRWTVTIVEPEESTLYNIFISGDDENNNDGELGIESAADVIDDEGVDGDAIVFQADIALPDPLVTPADGATEEFQDPFFITIDFGAPAVAGDASEDDEYGEDGHDQVTLALLELDDVDVLSSASSADGTRWLVAIRDVTIGEHTLTFNAEDEAGNELADDISIDFEVAERDDFVIELQPGWNLVSFPGTPADSAIGAAIGNTPVTVVWSYDPSVEGFWSVAFRDTADDAFSGTLETIDAGHGYWMLTDSFKELEVAIPALAGGTVAGGTPIAPPTLSLVEGWNLVPVVDVTGDLDAGDFIDSDVYFTGLEAEISRIYTFDTVANAWALVVRDGNSETAGIAAIEALEVGKAYWVYMTDSGVVVP